jgi:type I restriction enzyme S subunit
MESRTRSLESICSLIVDCPHSTPVWTNSGYVVLRNQNIRHGRLNISEPSFTDAEHFAGRNRRAKPTDGDIVITREAPMGEVCMIPDGLECCLGQRQVLLRPDPKLVNPKFLLYALQSSAVRHQIGWNEGTGSTVSNIRIPVLKSLSIPAPRREVQDDIADILGAIDSRIDGLGQTNATLEAIAQSLFKSWFVDFDPVRAKAEGREPGGMDAATASLFPGEFENSELGQIPKGWRVGGLGKCCNNVRVQAKPEKLDPNTPYIGLEHMPRKSIALSAWGVTDGLASGKSWHQSGDVLFGKLRPYFHKVGIASREGVCSTDILVIRSRAPEWFGFSAMHLSSDALISYATQLSNGAKMPRTNWHDIAAYKVAMPDNASAAAFDAVARPLIARLQIGIDAMHSLTELRDTLLPRLISGKLRLPEAEALAADTA